MFVAAAVVAVLLAEAGFRIFSPQERITPGQTIRWGVHAAWPANAVIKHRTCEYNVSYQTNALGFRGRNFPDAKPNGIRRIAVLGPSTIFGLGVADDETFPALLEARLNEAVKSPVYEVLNLAVVGTGIPMSEFLYRAVGRRYSPDVVMFHAYLPSREPFSNQAVRPWIPTGDRVSSGRLSRIKNLRRFVKVLPGYVFLCENSHLMAHFRHVMAFRLERPVLAPLAVRPKTGDHRDQFERSWLKILRSLKDEVCGDGATLLVLYDPSEVRSFPMIDEFLSRPAETGCFDSLPLKLKSEDWFDDGHWKLGNHRRVAEAAFHWLSVRGFR